jgi:endonuclease/exonuclease/phosphatase family metal-dependent hydrolase
MPTTSIATWNLENLFRPGSSYGPSTEATYHKKLDHLASEVLDAAPDVLAVQEVGQPEALEDLRSRLGPGWTSLLSSQPDGRGIRVGFLAKVSAADASEAVTFAPALAPVQIGDVDATLFTSVGQMSRGVLAARFHLHGTDVWCVTAHLKSKLLTYPGGRFYPFDENERARYAAYALFRRTAEAATIRTVVNSLMDHHPERRVMVMGDLNDTQTAATTQLLNGPEGSQIGTAGYSRPDAGDRCRLWNLAALIAPERRFSRVTEGVEELIDHILVSHRLVQGVEAVDARVAHLANVGTDPRLRSTATSSDHAMVIAKVTL